MTANANVTQFVEDLGAVAPAFIEQILAVLNMILNSPILIILFSITFIAIGYRIGLGIYRKMRR